MPAEFLFSYIALRGAFLVVSLRRLGSPLPSASPTGVNHGIKRLGPQDSSVFKRIHRPLQYTGIVIDFFNIYIYIHNCISIGACIQTHTSCATE